jgi:ubiquitin carboxyl-terminal hydrolase 36/42
MTVSSCVNHTHLQPFRVGESIKAIMTGHLLSSVQCDGCRKSSNKVDPFLDIALEVRGCDSITKALHRFSKPDRLTGSNKYACPK